MNAFKNKRYISMTKICSHEYLLCALCQGQQNEMCYENVTFTLCLSRLSPDSGTIS